MRRELTLAAALLVALFVMPAPDAEAQTFVPDPSELDRRREGPRGVRIRRDVHLRR